MAAVVFLRVVRPHGVDDGPFAALPVIVQVHCLFDSLQVNFGLVVCPGAKFHLAVLLIKGEEGDVDAAGALVDGWGDPADLPVVEQVSLGHVGDGKLAVCTGDSRVHMSDGDRSLKYDLSKKLSTFKLYIRNRDNHLL